MPRTDAPSYADLAYDVLQGSEDPLTFDEIFDEVNRRKPITTKNPKATIRNALTQGWQLINLGNKRYGYLPHLVRGSVLRLSLTEKKPAQHPLYYSGEVRDALWPSFFEFEKRRVIQPIQATLPSGDQVPLTLEFLGDGVWGTQIPEGLRRYLVEQRAAAGDSLLVRATDVEAGHCEVWFEPRRRRDDAAVASRNRELADAVYQILKKNPSRQLPSWSITPTLISHGFYHAAMAPDELETVLGADSRFVDGGFSLWMLAEDMTPDMRLTAHGRDELDDAWDLPEEEPAIDVLTDILSGASPRELRAAMERAVTDIGAILAEQGFESIEEANAFLQDLLADGGPLRRPPETDLERAQDLIYDAWEAPKPRERIRMARKALEISPDCADAYVLLADETARNPAEAAELYAQGMAAGERALGEETFELDAGAFWGILETRPYMRARFGLMMALWALGQQEEAIGHASEMLRLNPGDNQGVRYLLLSWLLARWDDAQVPGLLDLYPDDAAAMWQYGRALHQLRAEGDTPHARRLLDEAKASNPYVPAYLLGRKRLPSRLPEMIGLGDESEAIYCAAGQIDAWRDTPGALAWLQGENR